MGMEGTYLWLLLLKLGELQLEKGDLGVPPNDLLLDGIVFSLCIWIAEEDVGSASFEFYLAEISDIFGLVDLGLLILDQCRKWDMIGERVHVEQ